MRLSLPKLFALLVAGSLCGCRSPQPTAAMLEVAAPATSAKRPVDLVTRNNSVALLDELLNEEKDVSLILIIKVTSPELKQLVKNISQTASKGAKLLASEKKKDPGLELKGNGLPPGEKAARAGLSKTKEHELLSAKGAEFELQLLLTQAEALGYGAQLALDAAVNDPQPVRARQLASLSSQLKLLHEQVIAMLRTRPPGVEK